MDKLLILITNVKRQTQNMSFFTMNSPGGFLRISRFFHATSALSDSISRSGRNMNKLIKGSNRLKKSALSTNFIVNRKENIQMALSFSGNGTIPTLPLKKFSPPWNLSSTPEVNSAKLPIVGSRYWTNYSWDTSRTKCPPERLPPNFTAEQLRFRRWLVEKRR